MPEFLASFISNFIVAGPLACGLLATCFARKVFHDSWATCIVIGIVAAILVALVIGPMHKEQNPNLYDTRDHSLLGPQPGDKVNIGF